MVTAYIHFGETESEFAFGCVTGSFGGAGDNEAIAFDWGGADEMDETHGDGWAKLQDDGSLVGEITFHNGDESGFIARRWEPSSPASPRLPTNRMRSKDRNVISQTPSEPVRSLP